MIDVGLCVCTYAEPYPPGLPPEKVKYRPPLWESKLHGEPFGRFKPEQAHAVAAAAAAAQQMGRMQVGGGVSGGANGTAVRLYKLEYR
jgi:hypothetical protein